MRDCVRIIFLLSFLIAFSAERAVAQTPMKPALGMRLPLQPRQARTGLALDTTGWRFAAVPICAAIDDKSGEVRFRIVIDKEGVIKSVDAVVSTVSARQEALCRQALLQSRFEHTGAKPGGTTGYYTFRISIR